ncbi:MAG: endonuclease/exonuclease/phosphatase family protein [Pseudolabrys sp.]
MSDALPPFDHPSAPADVRGDMQALRAHLAEAIPQKYGTPPNALIATWNVREFGGLTAKWTAAGQDSPKRDWRGLWAITEIISRFDIVAVQEVGGNLLALRTLMKTLGPAWNFIMTDVTLGTAAGGERLEFVFDTRRVQMSGLACELVVPPDWQQAASQHALHDQFARTPYAVSFRRGGKTFVLVTLHVKYGGAEADRVPELQGIADWIADWAKRTTEWEQNFIVLEDFNIDRASDPAYEAFVSRGLSPSKFHEKLPRTIFDKDDMPDKAHFYDQIAWFHHGGKAMLNLTEKSGGNFDFRLVVYRDVGLTLAQMSFRVSDHYPLWVEFDLAA